MPLRLLLLAHIFAILVNEIDSTINDNRGKPVTLQVFKEL